MHTNKDENSISNDDIDLQALVNTFVAKHTPGILTKAVEGDQNMTDSLDYYDAFAKYVAVTKYNNDGRPVKRWCPTLPVVAETDLIKVVHPRHSTTLIK